MPAVTPLGPHGRMLADDYARRTDKIRVDLATDTYVTLRLFTMFVSPGDTLLIIGEANLTNNTGRSLTTGAVTGKQYPVGIAASLWVYDANAPADVRAATWLRLGTNGENSTVDGHHIQQGLARPYTVPAAWDPTHQIGVVLRVDVHSTGYDDNPTADYMLVEKHGTLMALHWPLAVAADPDIAALEMQLAATQHDLALLGQRVLALETAPPAEECPA